jgi:hypothetical protein
MYRTFVIGLFTAAVATSAHAQRVDSTPPFDATAPQLLTGDLNGDGKPDVVLCTAAPRTSRSGLVRKVRRERPATSPCRGRSC